MIINYSTMFKCHPIDLGYKLRYNGYRFINSFKLKQPYITFWKSELFDYSKYIDKIFYLYILNIGPYDVFDDDDSSPNILIKKINGPFTMERALHLDTHNYFVLQIHPNDENYIDFTKNNLMPNSFGWFISTSNTNNIGTNTDFGTLYWFDINIVTKFTRDSQPDQFNPNKFTHNKWWIGNFGVLYDDNNIKEIHKKPYLTYEVDINGPYRKCIDMCALLLSGDNSMSYNLPHDVVKHIILFYYNLSFS